MINPERIGEFGWLALAIFTFIKLGRHIHARRKEREKNEMGTIARRRSHSDTDPVRRLAPLRRKF